MLRCLGFEWNLNLDLGLDFGGVGYIGRGDWKCTRGGTIRTILLCLVVTARDERVWTWVLPF